jgi:vacuolar-type H+-ATPase subunit I/STV1
LLLPKKEVSQRDEAIRELEGQVGELEGQVGGLEGQVGELEGQVGGLEGQVGKLENQVGERDLRILQKDALIQELEARLLAQQRSLDNAIQEVVRAKAKQRSVGSRAQAASEMAEAEIALKTFRAKAAGTDNRELAQAEHLLKLASGEFEKQNFGGALYLTNRAKGRIKLGILVLDDQQKVGGLVGETRFAVPVSLTLKAASNLRKGPGLEFEVLGVLEKGTPLNGYSFKGSWLRVENGDGTSGWIHQSLVNAG